MVTLRSKRNVAVIEEEPMASSPTTATARKKPRTTPEGGNVGPAADSNTTQLETLLAKGLTTPENRRTRVVTPSQTDVVAAGAPKSEESDLLPLRRQLLASPSSSIGATSEVKTVEEPKAKKRLAFGKFIIETPCQKNVQETYKIISRLTGSVGGNGSFGPIYGELTMGSMQKMVDLMKTHTGFDVSSRFIDVGSGIGKPNLHVCQDPGVEFSYGIEMEMSRWMLGMTNLRAILKAARSQESCAPAEERIGYKCNFGFGNIMDAESFDPFTHVYMFSIGFPPMLFFRLAEMFNKSLSAYLICYHSPNEIINHYGFDVELVVQAPTSMHGSSEGHMGYIYKRVGATDKQSNLQQVPCAPYFQASWDAVDGGIDALTRAVESRMQKANFGDRVTRSRGVKMTAVAKSEQKEAMGRMRM